MTVRFLRREWEKDEQSVERTYAFADPGTLVAPYSDFPGLAAFAHDVEIVEVSFYGHWSHPNVALVLGEIRTAGMAVPAATATWGRIKAAYRE